MRSFTVVAATAALFGTVIAQDNQGVSTFTPSDPVVKIVNTSPSGTHVYKVEGNSDNPAGALGADGAPIPMITIAPGQTVNFHPGPGFIGAFSSERGAGTRFEVNFRGDSPGDYKTWYNSDMEFGMSDTTLRPTNGDKQFDGHDAIAGEQDVLAKVNAAWGSVDKDTQAQLLATGYVEGSTGADGSLTAVHNDKQAPPSIINFFQNTAELNSYVSPGNVAGRPTTESSTAADLFSWSVATNKLTLTGY